MKIAIDLDEVMACLLESVNDYYNKKNKTNFKVKDFYTYDWWSVWNISQEEAIEEFFIFMKSNLSKQIKPVKDAIESINILKDKFEIIVITARQEEFKEQTEEWIKKHFPGLEQSVYFTNVYSRSFKPSKKSDVALKLGVNTIIEDQVVHAYDCANKGIKVILLDSPWNQDVSGKNIERVYSWDEIIKKLID
jgi:uncharacterized HAD superfamily protein